MARPIPELPPVTTITLSFNRMAHTSLAMPS
jgi:hypothetical protein